MEDCPGDLFESSEDVSGRGAILSSRAASSKLSAGCEQVDVVRSAVVLRHPNDGPVQRSLAVMVGTMLSNTSSELGNLDLFLELLLEARIDTLR